MSMFIILYTIIITPFDWQYIINEHIQVAKDLGTYVHSSYKLGDSSSCLQY